MVVDALRKALPYTSAAVVVAAIYLGWTFYSRASSDKASQQVRTNAVLENDKIVSDLYGGGNLKIVDFYAAPSVLHKGQPVRFCYSVAHATTVKVEPFVEELTPSLARCFDAKPERTAEFTLTATDAQGHTQKQSLTIQVR